MSAGIIQLVSTGVQDKHLTSNPEISFFRSAFKRHTNFSMFNAEQVIRGQPGPGRMSTVNILRQGDLLSYMFIVASNVASGVTEQIDKWSEIIDSVELLIGGQVIDKQDTEFNEELAIDLMATNFSKSYAASLHAGLHNDSLFYPLRFFCCESWQSVLPLVALQYHDVEIRINWSPTFNNNNLRFNFSCNYVALDVEERKFFVSTPKDILIFQVQKSTASNEKIQEITFNHPIKYLCSSNANPEHDNKLCSAKNKIKCSANGLDITEVKPAVPYYTTIPSYYHTEFSVGNINNIFLVPFCLSTCKLQPTGTLNFSRLDSFLIHSELPITRPIYGVNYNILSIKNGMAGLLYSN